MDSVTIERWQFDGLFARSGRTLDVEEENQTLKQWAIGLLPHCRFCQGLGAVIREDDRGRVTEWPCIDGCEPPPVPIRVNNRRRI